MSPSYERISCSSSLFKSIRFALEPTKVLSLIKPHCCSGSRTCERIRFHCRVLQNLSLALRAGSILTNWELDTLSFRFSFGITSRPLFHFDLRCWRSPFKSSTPLPLRLCFGQLSKSAFNLEICAIPGREPSLEAKCRTVDYPLWWSRRRQRRDLVLK